MENTGRIRKPLIPAARRIVLGQGLEPQNREELWHISQVDLAHVLMLARQGIVSRHRAARLLAAIVRLRDSAFAPLQQRQATRGTFLLYEDFLIETEGAEIGGILQTARSRNDLNATVLKLHLRKPYLHLLQQAIRFHAVLLRRSQQYAQVIMPLYTHGQAAMPSTYGHYLAGIATALARDLEGLFSVSAEMQRCPLGAGAVAGTAFPIDPRYTSTLLGFALDSLNSLDAVANRDLVLQLLAAASIYSVNVSRLAADMLQWTTAEFDFLRLPDELVGSSSAMPQKRNPFLLEHVLGRTSSQLSAFVESLMAMHSAPFTNSISVGTEAVKPLWKALQSLNETVHLMCLIVGHAIPNQDKMCARALQGFTIATEFANRLVSDHGFDFRSAHRIVGEAISTAIEKGSNVFEEVAGAAAEKGLAVAADDFSPAAVVRSLEFGGGPGPRSMKTCLEHLRETWSCHLRQLRSLRKSWQEAEVKLQEAVTEFSGLPENPLAT
ncbi:MAG TPA: argininosuccinate lyase [Candidatus Angelobacter sp.]|jgi:argininosuccinate lyase